MLMVGTKWKKKNYCRFDASFLCFVNPLREILEALPGYGTTAAARAALSIPIISVCSIFVCLSNGKAASVVVVFVCTCVFCFVLFFNVRTNLDACDCTRPGLYGHLKRESALKANSKHWFTTSFLQPLPYLVTP